MSQFTHFNEQGRAKMVDITNKEVTHRTAIAKTSVLLHKEIYEKIANNDMIKGDVLAVAQVGGVMAAKNTSNWIPMCHPLQLSVGDITFELEEKEESQYELHVEVLVKTKGSTGEIGRAHV